MAKEQDINIKEELKKDVAKVKKPFSSDELMGINIIGKAVSLILAVWLISVSYYAFAFFVLGMLPALLASLFDRGAGRFASKTISATNFVGIVPYLFDIGLSYEKTLYAKEIMFDYETWFIIYGFAFLGWIMIWILPQITLIIFTAKAEYKTIKLKMHQEKLIEEWGEGVKNGKQNPLPDTQLK